MEMSNNQERSTSWAIQSLWRIHLYMMRFGASLMLALRLASYSDLVKEMEEVTYCTGKRNVYWTFSMEYYIDLLRAVLNGWAQMSKPYSDRFRFAFDVNHITAATRNKAAHEGQPDMYGLEGPDEPLTNILLTGRGKTHCRTSKRHRLCHSWA